MNIKAIVTGAAGFIGSHLCDLLLSQDYEVVGVDNEINGCKSNLAKADTFSNFHYHKADIADYMAIEKFFDNVDWVFHLAGMADIVPSIRQPIDYFRANVQGTFNVLEASRLAGVKRFVYAASSSSYGLAEIIPTPETAPINPMYPYALTKYMGEEAVLHFEKVYKLPSVSLRLFNVYGPRSRTTGTYGAVFGVFLAQKLAGYPLTVVGDGNQTRDFTFVSDVVRAFIMAAQSNVSGTAMNIGSGGTYSINRLVELLGGTVEYIPKRPGEPDCTFADTRLVEQVLGWKAQVCFEEGVAKMLRHIKDWSDAPLWNKAAITSATSDWFRYLG